MSFFDFLKWLFKRRPPDMTSAVTNAGLLLWYIHQLDWNYTHHADSVQLLVDLAFVLWRIWVGYRIWKYMRDHDDDDDDKGTPIPIWQQVLVGA